MLLSLMAAAAARSTHDVLYAAIIAAAAAIVGGIIGGSIPGFFMLKAEDKRHDNARELAAQARDDERERERRAVIGTARALYDFYARVGLVFGVALETQKWYPDELDATMQPPALDDLKAVYGQLTSYEAGVVISTMRLIELVRSRHGNAMNDQGPDVSGLPPLTEAEREYIEAGLKSAQDAIEYLRRVADLPKPADVEKET